MPGFGPAAEALLFRQKDPKPLLPGRGPVRVPSSQAKVKWRTTRLAQTGSPQSWVWPGTQPRPRQGSHGSLVISNVLNRESLFPMVSCLQLLAGIFPGKFQTGFRPRTTTHFGFGQSGQTHVGRSVSPCLRRGKLFGFLARFASSFGLAQDRPGSAQTRMAQTMRVFFPVSAAPLGHTTRPGEPEGSDSLITEN